MKKLLLCFCSVMFGLMSVCFADAVDDEIAQRMAIVEQLKSAIAEIDSEMMQCKKSDSLWKTATIVGGVGVVTTGTAAAIQAGKLKKAKKTKATE